MKKLLLAIPIIIFVALFSSKMYFEKEVENTLRQPEIKKTLVEFRDFESSILNQTLTITKPKILLSQNNPIPVWFNADKIVMSGESVVSISNFLKENNDFKFSKEGDEFFIDLFSKNVFFNNMKLLDFTKLENKVLDMDLRLSLKADSDVTANTTLDIAFKNLGTKLISIKLDYLATKTKDNKVALNADSGVITIHNTTLIRSVYLSQSKKEFNSLGDNSITLDTFIEQKINLEIGSIALFAGSNKINVNAEDLTKLKEAMLSDIPTDLDIHFKHTK